MGTTRAAETSLGEVAMIGAGTVDLRVAFGTAANPRGTLVVLTGRTEFIEKYEELTKRAQNLGLNTVVFDWRGQGGSSRLIPDRHKGHVASFDDYLVDADAVMHEVNKRGLSGPFGLYGHSMGGHMALRSLAHFPSVFRGAILTAPMFDIEFGAMPRPMARILAALAVKVGLGEHYIVGQKPFEIERQVFEGNRLTSDPDGYQRFVDLLNRLPDFGLGGITYGWLDAAFKSMDQIVNLSRNKEIHVPVWICQSSDDKIVNNAAQDFVAEQLPSTTLMRFEGARHEILLENASLKERFFATFDRFVEAVIAPTDAP